MAPAFYTELQVAIEGAFEKTRFLALLRDFIVFEDDGGGALAKKMAGYHQFHAVETAVAETLRAAALRHQPAGVREERGRYESGSRPGGAAGDRRIGVVWHTQGSGKSLTMAFYAGRIVREPAMRNPTVVVLTDRNDLDDQLFATFSRCADLLRQPPVQAESRADLRARLAVESGGVVFTTIQKFFPEEKGDRRAPCRGAAHPRHGVRLDPARERPRPPAPPRQRILRKHGYPPEKAGGGRADGVGAGGGSVHRRGGVTRSRSPTSATVLSGRVRRDQVGENPPAGGWPVADLMMRGCATR